MTVFPKNCAEVISHEETDNSHLVLGCSGRHLLILDGSLRGDPRTHLGMGQRCWRSNLRNSGKFLGRHNSHNNLSTVSRLDLGLRHNSALPCDPSSPRCKQDPGLQSETQTGRTNSDERTANHNPPGAASRHINFGASPTGRNQRGRNIKWLQC